MYMSLLSEKCSFILEMPTETLDSLAPHCGHYYGVMVKLSLAKFLGL